MYSVFLCCFCNAIECNGWVLATSPIVYIQLISASQTDRKSEMKKTRRTIFSFSPVFVFFLNKKKNYDLHF